MALLFFWAASVVSGAGLRAGVARIDTAGHPVLDTPYPVQAICFGRTLTLLALGGEAVVDYSLRAQHEYPGEALIVAEYSNDVCATYPRSASSPKEATKPSTTWCTTDNPARSHRAWKIASSAPSTKP